MTLNGKVGDKIFIKCVNPKNQQEYSVYRITIEQDAYRGDEIGEIFLAETTGYEKD